METSRDFSGNIQPEVYEKPGQSGERIEVEINDTNPLETSLKLRQQSWAGGMGWFTQKTITVNPEEVPALIQQLEQSLVSLKLSRSQAHHRRPTVTRKSSDENKIIEFPKNRTASKSAPAELETFANNQGKVLLFEARKRAR